MNDIEQQFNISKQFFKTNKTKDLKFRKHQLKALSKSIKNHEQALLEALNKDLGKSKVEAYATEIGILLKSIKLARKELKIGLKLNKLKHRFIYFQLKVISKTNPTVLF